MLQICSSHQMEIEINLIKSENDVWGFRLTGGAEYDAPFIVVHVSENSIAERSGLQCNDIIVNVNGISTVGLKHNETHELLLSGRSNLNLRVKRNITDVTLPTYYYDDESSEEVCNIMQPYLENETNDYNNENSKKLVDEAALDTKMCKLSSTTNNLSETQRKWSTFLQKPTNPKPVPKITDEVIKAAPYRVLIQKQTKKSLESKSHDILSEIQPEKQPPEFDKFELGETIEEPNEKEEKNCEDELIAQEKSEAEDYDKKLCKNDLATGENDIKDTEPEVDISESQRECDAYLNKFLEEKLTEVQKQLEELSKLPSTLQSTIHALNKQLATIVGTDTTHEDESELLSEVLSENSFLDQNVENIEEVVENHEIQDQDSDEIVEDSIEHEEVEEIKNISPQRPLQEENSEEEDENVDGSEEELLKNQKTEQEQIEDFKQRRLKQKPTLPFKPIERPIVLPGGRRWSQPEDACPVIQHSKMSDEKIANTIETFSEVINGKTKGLTIGINYGHGSTKKRLYTAYKGHLVKLPLNHPVLLTDQEYNICLGNNAIYMKIGKPWIWLINFMKYEPQLKNLDYLQRSDVYKLVHDLEPPVRGISSRASKILAEQDYY